MEFVTGFRELKVYKLSRQLSKGVFEVSKTFPKQEMYSLTDQIRRSSRSIGAQIAEAWGKRRYYYQLEPLFGQFSGQVIKKITRIIPIKPGKRRSQQTDLHLYGTCKVSCFFNIVSAYCFVYSRVLSPGLRARAVLMAFKASRG